MCDCLGFCVAHGGLKEYNLFLFCHFQLHNLTVYLICFVYTLVICGRVAVGSIQP